MSDEDLEREGAILWALAVVCAGVAILNLLFG